MSRKASTASRKPAAPRTASVRMSPTRPESAVTPANSERLRNTKPSITMPSKARSTTMVASAADMGVAEPGAHPGVAGAAQRPPETPQPQASQRQPQEDGADGQADPELPAFQGASRDGSGRPGQAVPNLPGSKPGSSLHQGGSRRLVHFIKSTR